MPRGLVAGMAIATLFYLLTSFAVVVALPWQTAAASPRSLADALGDILAGLGLSPPIGFVLMSLGGLLAIASSYEVFTLTLARLSYAMARDGLWPSAFARLHPRFGTPYVGLLFQAASAPLVALVFDLTDLLACAVFFLGISYAVTALAALRLMARAPGQRLHLPGLRGALVLAALGGAYLSLQVPPRLIGIGAAVMAVGLGLFVWGAGRWQPRAQWSGEQHIPPWAHRGERWLLHLLRRS
jgi:amino acid transporter